MDKDFFVNKVLPLIIIVISTIILTLLFFVFLFGYINNKQIDTLEKKGDVVNVDQQKVQPYVFSEETLQKLIPPSDAKPYVFSEETLQKLIPPSDAKPYVFSEEVLKKLIPPGY